MKQLFTFLLLGSLALAGFSQNTKGPVDLPSVRIGKQQWAIQNLNVTTYQNGDPIQEAKTEEEWKKCAAEKKGCYCSNANDATNAQTYGYLYNWYAFMDPRGIAPNGWHVPTVAEWEELIHIAGNEKIAGAAIRNDKGWPAESVGDRSNTMRFSSLPGGGRYVTGAFSGVGKAAIWWSSTEVNEKIGNSFGNKYTSQKLVKDNAQKGAGLSIRCIHN
jgi:uncharacterized protein (TIGR02145 family)